LAHDPFPRPVVHPGPAALGVDEAGLTQSLEMVGDRRAGQGERGSEVADADLPVGAKSYGRAPTFLLATGYEQARSVVAALAGDWVAARDVQLDLPETGVCDSNPVLDDDTITASGGCCGS
jgi:hypothetical protein